MLVGVVDQRLESRNKKCAKYPITTIISRYACSDKAHSFVNPRDIELLWRDQFDWVYREMDYAVFAITIHPDVSGRPQVILMLERLIEYINKHSAVEWMTFEQIAYDFRRRFPFKDSIRPQVI